MLMHEGVHDANMFFWNGAYKTSYTFHEESSMLYLFTYPEYFLTKPLVRRNSKKEWIMSLKVAVTGAFTRITMFLGFDIVAFGMMVYYFSETMTETEMRAFILDGDQDATNMPDEPSDMTVVR